MSTTMSQNDKQVAIDELTVMLDTSKILSTKLKTSDRLFLDFLGCTGFTVKEAAESLINQVLLSSSAHFISAYDLSCSIYNWLMVVLFIDKVNAECWMKYKYGVCVDKFLYEITYDTYRGSYGAELQVTLENIPLSDIYTSAQELAKMKEELEIDTVAEATFKIRVWVPKETILDWTSYDGITLCVESMDWGVWEDLHKLSLRDIGKQSLVSVYMAISNKD